MDNKNDPYKVLPWELTLSGQPWNVPPPPQKKRGYKGSFDKNKKSKFLLNLHENNDKINFNSKFLLPCKIQVNSQNNSEQEFISKALIDTGALNGNYINKVLFQKLEKLGIKINKQKKNIICHVLGRCFHVVGEVDLNILFNFKNNNCNCVNINENQNLKHTSIFVNCILIDSPYDIIIGLPTIIKYNLLQLFEQYIKCCECMNYVEKNVSHPQLTNTTHSYSTEVCIETINNNKLSEGDINQIVLRNNNEIKLLMEDRETNLNSLAIEDTVKNNKCLDIINEDEFEDSSSILNQNEIKLTSNNLANFISKFNVDDNNKYVRISKNEVIDCDSDEESLNFQTTQDDPFSHEREEIHHVIPTKIYGRPEFQNKIIELCKKYISIFSTKLNEEPADIPPFEIQCDKTKWLNNKNRQPPRIQSVIKQNEIIKQVKDMLKNKIVKTSEAIAYSQVLLVPKPNQKWRFCIDYRSLNKCCTSSGWPIPNINQMFARIGAIRPHPKIFAKIDFTSGYHQAPLSKSSRPFTAFITFLGVFEWLRVPMGPKGSASYFQQMIATVVLVGLIYLFVELYIDDILIHAPTEELFLERLETVFIRFVKHRITINPEKCIFGVSEIEFVGHNISENGITFTRERIERVLDITFPQTQKGLKKFLGVINYFRDHIENHSILVQLLQIMVNNYQPNKFLIWSEEAINAFNKVKDEINNCPTLSFLDDKAPIYLITDASDYGIGAYLFQLIDNKEQPIAFMSKSLSEREKRWSNPEKECFAIFYSLIKFEYLLRDVHFCIRTDHKNLTFLNESANLKVNRWKLKIQHFDFDIEYLPGNENIIADIFSRMVINNDNNNSNNNVNAIINRFTINANIYKKIRKVHNSISGHYGLERTMLNWEIHILL